MDERTNFHEYILPPISLLKKNSNNKISSELLIKNAEILKQLFVSFGINVNFEGACIGPRYTRYEIRLEKGIRVNKILRLKDEIILKLKANDVYFEVPIPGKTTVGINIENEEKYIVTLREILESKDFKNDKLSSAFVLGKNVIGNNMIVDIDDMIHLLISGSSGTGKSSFIDSIIMSILYTKHSEDVKFILVNTVNANFNIYNGISHLLFPVLNDYKSVRNALIWTISEMQERYKKISYYNVSDINSYNNKIQSGSELLQKIPKIVLIIDDMTDFMIMDEEIEECLCRLTQMSMACGIHVIISTQISVAKLIPGSIKENIPSRIAFDVFSVKESETIINQKGAESLSCDGDMLFLPRNCRKPIRIQGAFVSDSEICNTVNFLINNSKYKH